MLRPASSGIQVGRLYIDPARRRVVMSLRRYERDGWIGGEVNADGKELLRRNGRSTRREGSRSHK
ncbi:MAG TPA: hypothetical protein VGP84_03365 [Gemmatimonadaceae bacterium]|nr:hypothetical protein [Gemmatimonadaceae bacterium]